MTAPGQARAGYGPVQLAAYLGLERWQLSRAVQGGLVGGPDLARGRWSAAAAAAVLARAAQIRQAAGSVPDLGAVRAAAVLSERPGTCARRTRNSPSEWTHCRRRDRDHLE